MKRSIFILVIGLICAFSMPASAATQDEQRTTIQNMRTAVLDKLYSAKPELKEQVEKAAGYAVFSSADVAAIYLSGAYGRGLAHNNHNGDQTYMQMASVGVGLGLGAKDFRAVFIFKTPAAFHDFVTTGLDLSGNLDLAAKQGAKGGDVGAGRDVMPDVQVYQLTEKGLLASAMVEGTKYWPDAHLNAYEQSSDAGETGYHDSSQK